MADEELTIGLNAEGERAKRVVEDLEKTVLAALRGMLKESAKIAKEQAKSQREYTKQYATSARHRQKIELENHRHRLALARMWAQDQLRRQRDATLNLQRGLRDQASARERAARDAIRSEQRTARARQAALGDARRMAMGQARYISDTFSTIDGAFRGMVTLVTSAVHAAAIAIGSIFGPTGALAAGILGGVLTTIPRLFADIIGQVIRLVGRMVATIVRVIQSLVQTVWKILSGIVNAAISITTSVIRVFSDMAGRIGGMFGGIASTGTKTFGVIGLAIAGLTVVAVRNAAILEHEMMQAFVLVGERNRQVIDQITRQVNLLTTAVPVAPRVAARGYYDILSAGITKAADAMKVLNVAAKASVAHNLDIETSVKAVIRILAAFYNTDANKAAEAMDYLSAIVEKGVIRMEDLAHGIGVIAGPAASAGIALQDLAGSLALVTRLLPPDIAIRGLRRLIVNLVAPSEKASEAMKDLGLVLRDNQGQFIGIREAALEFQRKGVTSLEKMRAVIGDVRGAAAMAALLRQLDQFNFAFGQMGNVAGKTEQMFQQMMSTLISQFKLAWNNVVALTNTFGRFFLPVVVPILKKVNEGLKAVNEEFDKLLDRMGSKKKTEWVVDVETGKFKLVEMEGWLTKWVGNMTTLMQDVGTIMWDEFEKGFPRVRKMIDDVNTAWTKLMQRFFGTETMWQAIRKGAGLAFAAVFNIVQGVSTYIENTLIPAINKFLADLVGGLKNGAPQIAGYINQMITSIEALINAVVLLGKQFGNAFLLILNGLARIGPLMAKLIPGIGPVLSELMTKGVDKFKSALGEFGETLDKLQAASKAFSEAGSPLAGIKLPRGPSRQEVERMLGDMQPPQIPQGMFPAAGTEAGDRFAKGMNRLYDASNKVADSFEQLSGTMRRALSQTQGSIHAEAEAVRTQKREAESQKQLAEAKQAVGMRRQRLMKEFADIGKAAVPAEAVQEMAEFETLLRQMEKRGEISKSLATQLGEMVRATGHTTEAEHTMIQGLMKLIDRIMARHKALEERLRINNKTIQDHVYFLDMVKAGRQAAGRNEVLQ